jgi:fructose-bisphosphate aldolase class II
MHGSSSVPQDWLKIINDFGGDMGQTYGVPVKEIVEGLKSGVTKVNIDTDLRMASTGSVRRHLKDNPSNFDPRKFLKEATNGMKEICKARYEAFNSAGQASKITKIYSLDEMSQQYVAGDLDQKIS